MYKYFSEVEGDLQVPPEAFSEGRVHVQHLQDIVPLDTVKVTIGECPHVSIAMARLRVQVNGLT